MVLLLHIAGGIMSLFVALLAIIAMVNRTGSTKLYSFSLFTITIFELVTGGLLVYGGQSSFLSFCAKFAFYMSVVGSTQIALLLSARRSITSFSSSK